MYCYKWSGLTVAELPIFNSVLSDSLGRVLPFKNSKILDVDIAFSLRLSTEKWLNDHSINNHEQVIKTAT